MWNPPCSSSCVQRRGAAILAALVAALVARLPAPAAEPPHVVFVTGDCEYRSEITMPLVAELLEKRHGFRTTVCYAVNPDTGQRQPNCLTNITGLAALADADLAVFFVRFRQLPDDQLQRILDYARSGKPMVGLRTATHAFRYADGPHVHWNDDFGREFFGQRWIHHHGHDSSTQVYTALDAHPIVRGVKPEFHCRSWLYHVVPLVGDCRTLALGCAVRGESAEGPRFGTPNPVAWTRQVGPTRVFFTTLGHPQDLADANVRKLLVNGIFWALGRESEIPPPGCDVELLAPYDPPPTTKALPDPLTEREIAGGH